MVLLSLAVIMVIFTTSFAILVGITAGSVVILAFFFGVFALSFIPLFLNVAPFGSTSELRSLPTSQRRGIVFQRNGLQLIGVVSLALAIVCFVVLETQKLGL